MAHKIQELNDTQFEETVAQGVTLVDFWAPWCGPCRMQTPILEEIAGELAGQVAIAKINVDDYQENARRYGVQGIPTLILFKDGKLVNKFVGLQSKTVLMSALRTAASKAA